MPIYNPSAGGSGTVTSVTGTPPIASSGGATPAISLLGTDVNSSGNIVATHLSAALPVNQGGTGTTTPALVAGTNITSITGTWPNQTINAASSGALVLVEAHTASSSASLAFTTGITSTYDSYFFQLIDVVPATDANILFFTVSTDGGSTYAATNYKWADFRFVFNGSATGGTAAASTDTHILLNSSTDTVSNNASWGLNGNFYLYNPLGSVFKRTLSHTSYYNGTNIEEHTATGAWVDTTAVNAVKFAMNSGNIASGIIRCYGIAH